MNCSEWKKVKLKEISTEGKGFYGIGAPAVEYDETLFTYLRITDITDDGRIDKSGLTSVDAKNAKDYLLRENDIVFARTGNSTGRSYFYDKSDGDLVYAGFLIKFNLDETKVNPKYIKLYTLSDQYKNWVNSFATGSTRKNINAKMYGDMEINLPSRDYQNFVVNTIEPLNEKIEINSKIIEKIDEAAKAIFNQWFIEYNFPNEDGNPYKSSDGVMVDSKLGMIPNGWKVCELGDIVEFQNGYAFKSKELLEQDIGDCYHVFKMGHIKKGGGLNKSGTKSYIEKSKCSGLSKYMLQKGDLLMCMTDMKSNVALLGHTALMDEDNKYILNQRVGLLRTKDSSIINYPFLYLLTNDSNFIENLRSRANSGVQVNLSTKEIKGSLFVVPDSNIHKKFNEIVLKFYEKSFLLTQENEALIRLRDILLKKLMSCDIQEVK